MNKKSCFPYEDIMLPVIDDQKNIFALWIPIQVATFIITVGNPTDDLIV